MKENLNLKKKNDRLLYIDALRGLAMLMVVFVHVEIFSFFNFGHTTTLMYVLSSVHMPLFFFISGFCIYKPDRKCYITRVKKDFMRLILPAVIIGLLYTYLRKGEDLLFFFSNSMKAGYWFTISLFEILLVYYAIKHIIPNNDKAFIVVLWIVSGLLFLLKLPLKVIGGLEIVGNYLCLHQTFNYFVFFVLGVSIAKYKVKSEVLMSNTVFSTVVLLLFALGSLSLYGILPKYVGASVVWRVLDTLGETFVGMSGVLLLYIIFNKMQSVINSRGIFSRILLIVGNKTLPIYLIHYFLLPNLPQVGTFLIDYPSVLSELFLGLIISFMTIAASLIVNEIVRIASPFIGCALLGNRE